MDVVVEDIFEKAIRMDSKAVWITIVFRTSNQEGQLVSL
jgi:hypothetical protein